MLTSNITNLPMGSAISPRVLAASTTILRASGSLPRRPRSYQQVRAFRWGIWSSYLDPEFQQELRRRHRVIKHKYAKALNRDLSWDRHFPSHPKHLSLKGFMCSAWRGSDPRPGGRWVNLNELKSTNDNSGSTPGKGIEDVEQSAVNKLFVRRIRKFRDPDQDLPQRQNELQRFVGSIWSDRGAAPQSESVVYGQEGSRRIQKEQTANTELEYEIDPITNRKVFKNTSHQNEILDPIPVNTFKGYRSQFQNHVPPESTTNIPSSRSRQRQEKSDQKLPPSKESQDGLEAYDRKVDYQSGRLYRGNDNEIESHEQEAHAQQGFWSNFAAKESQKTQEQPQPDTLLDPVLKSVRDYENSSSRKEYKKKQHGEALLESIKEFQSMNHDRVVDEKASSDPILTAIREYESAIESYSRHGKSQDEILYPVLRAVREYNASLARKLDSNDLVRNQTIYEKLVELDPLLRSIREYEADMANGRILETNPSANCPVQEGLRAYDEKVANYSKPWNWWKSAKEDIKMRQPFRGEIEQEDMDLLRASDVRSASGIMKSSNKETEAEKSAARQQLEENFDKAQQERSEADEEIAALERVKLHRRLNDEVEELKDLHAEARSRVDAKIAEVEGNPSVQGSKQSKLSGNFVRDFPEEFQATWTDQGKQCLVPKDSVNLTGKLSKQNGDENGFISGRASSDAYNRRSDTQRLQTSLDRSKAASTDTENRKALIDPLQQGEGDLSASVSSYGFPKEKRAGETSDSSNRKLRRQAQAARWQGEQDFVREIRSIYEDAYGVIDTKHRQVGPDVSETATKSAVKTEAPPAEPTLYRILAWDPTSQSISQAETSSIVPDASSPLTPTEVLLRLSNPAKFFEYFGALQAEGFEIVSGGGDMLVFRKVRPQAPPGTKISGRFRYQSRDTTTTNPIDGMQGSPRPATGDFASPTGFVNHDLPRWVDPPFKSNIDVRREEPVFSGKRNWEDENEHKGRKGGGRAKKVVIGAAWVAACSYAIGVVADFFKTGGKDGKGPQGF